MLLVPGTAVQELAAWLQFLNRSVHVQGGVLTQPFLHRSGC
ncbi:hypothetical protein [Brachymonas wangyanguii]